MLYRFIKCYAVLSSLFVAVVLLETIAHSTDPISTALRGFTSHLTTMSRDAVQQLKSQSSSITTKFTTFVSQAR